jgi:hypothetical protein
VKKKAKLSQLDNSAKFISDIANGVDDIIGDINAPGEEFYKCNTHVNPKLIAKKTHRFYKAKSPDSVPVSTSFPNEKKFNKIHTELENLFIAFNNNRLLERFAERCGYIKKLLGDGDGSDI